MGLTKAPEAKKPVVVVIGGGFAGLNAAKSLAHKDVQVILIDQKNHHLFQPLLYQVATAGLNPGDIAVPIRAQFSGVSNAQVHMGRIEEVDLVGKTVRSAHAELKYDYLIVACGARHSYFAHPEWEENAPGLKTLEQATEIRRRILLAFERAENETDPAEQKALLTFVIVGGGPTGVELAGAIADISRTVLVRDFVRIDPSKARVILAEAGSRVLASFKEKISRRALKDLKALGVEVRTDTRVEKIDSKGVQIGKEWIESRTVCWAAGVQAAPLKFTPAPELDKAGRVVVREDFTITGHADVFVVGDMASYKISEDEMLPGLAPAAIQSGKYAAQAVWCSITGKPRPRFHYLNKGLMATIGKQRAVAQLGNLMLSGRFAWFSWLFVHILYLIGFKNRIAVLAQWTWNYLFSKRGSRLITDKDWKLKK
jgi:NADH dehydrogenase